MLTTPLAELQLLWHRWSSYDMAVATRTHLSKILSAVGHVDGALDNATSGPLQCRV